MMRSWIWTAFLVLMSAVASVFASTTEGDTPPDSTDSPGGGDCRPPQQGDDGLVTVDYVIIGVTCATVTGVLIGGIIYCVSESKKSDKAREETYQKYMQRPPSRIMGAYDNSGYN